MPGAGGTSKAAGWIKELKAQDDGIYGRVEWTAAAIATKRKESSYFSPEFFPEKTTGPGLAVHIAGLTNTPNLDLVAVAASALSPPTKMEPAWIRSVPLLAKGTSEDCVVAAINAHLISSSAIAGEQPVRGSFDGLRAFGRRFGLP